MAPAAAARRYTIITLLALLALAPALHAAPAHSSPSPPLIVNNYSFQIVVSIGGEKLVLGPGMAVEAEPGVEVCVESPRLLYTSSGVRLVLAGLLVDGRLAEAPCTLLSGSTLEPLYTREARVTILSTPPGVYTAEVWGPLGGCC
ncbi:hypothetical protein [Aeropyrum camini]|uniref:Xaa-Pro aminopeptidase n=1 Tax=Aeropyrum camini SY1 = JCM 12091 TaxID=1198449 RepID=U3TCR4_9CREN|nr:hypothetical protein [Aeropyrum camini]BAN90211.1 Xaa-Pro aminopeptidase [Aeropyrum camini SY1 = JCM 12091]